MLARSFWSLVTESVSFAVRDISASNVYRIAVLVKPFRDLVDGCIVSLHLASLIASVLLGQWPAVDRVHRE